MASSEYANDSADDLRQRGNHEFHQGNIDHALALYSAALERATASGSNVSPDDVCVILCNRSAAYFQLQDYENAKEDAERAWTLSNQNNIKAAYRLAKTFMALQAATVGTPTPLHFTDQVTDVLTTAIQLPHCQPQEKNALQDLLTQVQQQQKDAAASNASSAPETTIKGISRPVSIREFAKGKNLGVGNFSEIIVVSHKVTNETFALKILEKKQAKELAKRQHPNVYNEIAMESRVLMARLPPHPRIIQMYHCFEDYNNLYYLMDLHSVHPDLWSNMKYQGKMVGTHATMTKQWLLQLIDALEHMHSHGIVHRDLKPENILMNERNHVVVIDFGTAKDLIQTDLNGPEFVGTPDFMSPEAVTGFSGMPGDSKKTKDGIAQGATHTADLWALGAVAYILFTGSCPFWSPSPYLTFLRIKRGLLPRNDWAIPDDDAWDFCSSLVKVNPNERFGADAYSVEVGDSTQGKKGSVKRNKGYDMLRNHPYFSSLEKDPETDQKKPIVKTIVPSLQDLCIQACAEMAIQDAFNLEVCDEHPPGDGSRHDFLRLDLSQRKRILHVLDKMKTFKDGDETRVLQRFFANDVDYIKAKVRPSTRDFVGLTQMNDDEYKPQSNRGSEDPYAKKVEPEPTRLAILRNPRLCKGKGEEGTPEQEKAWLKGWKNSIAHINKQRPKAVVVSAKDLTPKYWKFLARIRDSIAVIWNDGSTYYTFWLHGFQGILLCKDAFDMNDLENCLQMKWLREQMEQSRMAKPQLFCFCDCDPRELPSLVIKRLARGRVSCLFGISEGEPVDYTMSYRPNETVGDDDTSVKSTDSQEDEDDAALMRVISGVKNGIDWLQVDEKASWKTSFEAIDMPSDS
eukprot:Nitzschia sp. Nitz4//scaffold47_size129522//100548//103188//NITZ4_003566-RA/size129522-snap-gene-0.188-mRNA-1//1//CDS//3329552845//7194//frame0